MKPRAAACLRGTAVCALGAAAAVVGNGVVAAAAAAAAAAAGDYPMQIHPRAWMVDQSAFASPEALAAVHWPEDDLAGLAGRPKTAIAFSGGGTRAFVASLGYLRALIDLGLMSTVRYLSGISGGSWAASAFTFFQKK
jgi:predicted acylesterase/phospholipase RssA